MNAGIMLPAGRTKVNRGDLVSRLWRVLSSLEKRVGDGGAGGRGDGRGGVKGRGGGSGG